MGHRSFEEAREVEVEVGIKEEDTDRCNERIRARNIEGPREMEYEWVSNYTLSRYVKNRIRLLAAQQNTNRSITSHVDHG